MSDLSQYSTQDIVREMLARIGDDPSREGLQETPKRVEKAWATWFAGYEQDPQEIMKVFEDGAEGVDQMVVQRDIPVYSHCEHHIAPILGVATVAYIPDGKILGLSKMNRLVDVYARRLQVQERLTRQIADAMWEGLKPKGLGVLIRARHLCVETRGIKHRGASTITCDLRGAIMDEPDTRAEFMRHADTQAML